MKRFLRALATCLVVSLMLVSMAGCGNVDKTSGKADDMSKPYEINWYFVGNLNQTDFATVENAINDYLKDKINVTVKMNALDWGTYDNRISMMLQSNEKFDLCFTTPWCANYNLNVAKGGFLEINDLITQYAPKTKELLGEEFLSGSQINGKNYAVPANKEKASSWGFVYRKDIADKYNIDMSNVKSFKDLLPILALIKDKEPGLIPLNMAGGRTAINELAFNSVSGLFGNFFGSDDGKMKNFAETPEYKEQLKLAREMYVKGYVTQDCALPTAKDYGTLTSNGMFFVTLEQLKPGKAKELTSTVKVPGVVYEQLETVPPRTTTGDATGSMMAIPKNCQNPIRVMKFLELLNTDPILNNLVNYGVEGKHYTKIDDNTISVNKEAGYTQAGCQWMFGNVFLNYLLPEENKNKHEELKAFNDRSTPSKLLGFSFDVETVRTELAAINNVMKEFQVPLETGSIDPNENLPKFIEKMRQAGSQTVVDEMQKQYDKWKLTTEN